MGSGLARLAEQRGAHAVGHHAHRADAAREVLRDRALAARDQPAHREHERLAVARRSAELLEHAVVVGRERVGGDELLGEARGPACAQVARERRDVRAGAVGERDAPLLPDPDRAAGQPTRAAAPLGQRAGDRAHVPAAQPAGGEAMVEPVGGPLRCQGPAR